MPSSEPTPSTRQAPIPRGLEEAGHIVLEQLVSLLQVHLGCHLPPPRARCSCNVLWRKAWLSGAFRGQPTATA
jgi:hypothetical protein